MTEKLKSILESFNDLLFIFDKRGVITDCISTNHKDELILPKEKFIGKSHRDVLPPDISDNLDQAFKELDEGKEKYKFDYSLDTQKGRQWYTAIISKFKQEDDTRYLGAVRNITDRKNRELLLRGILNTSPCGIMVLQTERNSQNRITDFIITQVNKSVEILTGATEEDLIGQKITEIVSGDFQENIFEYFKKALESGNPVEFQYPHRNEKRQEFWYQVKVAKYRDGVIGNFLDFTKQKNTQDKLAEINEELAELNREKNKLFSVVSHDLKNSVAGARGVYDLLLEDFDKLSKDEILEYLKLLNQRTNNTHELLKDLLDWTKTQFQEVVTERKKINLSSLADRTLDNEKSHAQSKEIELSNQIPDDLFVHADANMIKTVLRNLVSNGIKFSDAGGKIELLAERMNQEIKVSVKDEGIGMDEETLEKVMDKKSNFTSQGTSGEKGSGIGLDLCIDFVERHDGKIWVESEPGKGSVFHFTLPAYL